MRDEYFSGVSSGKELEAALRNEARWWFLKVQNGPHNWAREMVYRYVKTANLKEMGYVLTPPDAFSVDCFLLIQEELEKQRQLKEKHGKGKR